MFRDASPEGFGLALLEQLRGTTLADPMQRLELSEGDSVGAVEVCDDIDAKLAGLHAAIERGCGPADETRRPQAARAELAAVADMRRALSVLGTWTRI